MSRKKSALDFLRYYLPEEMVSQLDLSTLSISKDSFVDKELGEHFSDVLYQINLRDGREAKVYVLIDHKSSPDGLVAFPTTTLHGQSMGVFVKAAKSREEEEEARGQETKKTSEANPQPYSACRLLSWGERMGCLKDAAYVVRQHATRTDLLCAKLSVFFV